MVEEYIKNAHTEYSKPIGLYCKVLECWSGKRKHLSPDYCENPRLGDKTIEFISPQLSPCLSNVCPTPLGISRKRSGDPSRKSHLPHDYFSVERKFAKSQLKW